MTTMDYTPMSDMDEKLNEELESFARRLFPSSSGHFIFLCAKTDGRTTICSNVLPSTAFEMCVAAAEMLVAIAPEADEMLEKLQEVMPCSVKH